MKPYAAPAATINERAASSATGSRHRRWPGLEGAGACSGGASWIVLATVAASLPSGTRFGADAAAGLWEGEDGAVREVSSAELRRMTDALALRLEELGVATGDTVGVFMPMAPEAVAAMFACAKLGAIFIPIFSGYAADAVAT